MAHLVVGMVGLAVYVYVARNIKLRERDEACHVRHFVKEYYSMISQEELYNSVTSNCIPRFFLEHGILWFYVWEFSTCCCCVVY